MIYIIVYISLPDIALAPKPLSTEEVHNEVHRSIFSEWEDVGTECAISAASVNHSTRRESGYERTMEVGDEASRDISNGSANFGDHDVGRSSLWR